MATITTTDFNNLQARIARVMGVGDGDYGYGQFYTSTPVGVSDPITFDLYNNLRNDILRAKQHQRGIAYSTAIPELGQVVPTSTTWQTYFTVMGDVERDRLIIPPSSQRFRTELNTGSQVLSPNTWNGTSTYSFTASFESADTMRNYFNSGSVIEINSTFAASIASAKNTSWANLLTSIGVVTFGRNTTKSAKTTGGTSYGYGQLTSSFLTIFKKNPADVYLSNSYEIQARLVDDNAILFQVLFKDTSIILSDLNVTGVLTCVVNAYSSIDFVESPIPEAIEISFTAGAPTPTVTIERDVASISEGLTGVTFKVHTRDFYESNIYWKLTGAGITTSDFNETLEMASLSGTFGIEVDDSGVGYGEFYLSAAADAKTEGIEKFNIELRTVEGGPVVASIANALEKIDDLSTTPKVVIVMPTYEFLSQTVSSVQEGTSVSFTVITTNVAPNTEIFWTVVPLDVGLTKEDFADNTLNGSVRVGSNGTCVIDRMLISSDATNEGIEKFRVDIAVIDPVSNLKITKASSYPMSVIDTQALIIEKPFTLDSNNHVTSITEGSTTGVTFSVTGPDSAKNRLVYWMIQGELGTVEASDITYNGNHTLTGSVMLNSSAAANFTIYANSDNQTESLERFRLYLYSDSARTTQVQVSQPIDITEIVPYAIVASRSSAAEANGVTVDNEIVYSVTTPWLSNIPTDLYWTIIGDQGTIESSDFLEDTLYGTVSITGGAGSFKLHPRADKHTEGVEKFHVALWDHLLPGGIAPAGTPLATTANSLTSITETVPYTIMVSNTSTMYEGDNVGITFDIYTPSLPNGTNIWWEVVAVQGGTVQGADFIDNKSAWYIPVTDNHATLTLKAITDSITEGNESFQVRIRSGSSTGTEVALSEVVTISERIPYSIVPSTQVIAEQGDTQGRTPLVTFTVKTPKLANGTLLGWQLNPTVGNLTVDDISVSDADGQGSKTSGHITINNNTGSLIITALDNGTTYANKIESDEAFTIQLLDADGVILKESAQVQIRDISAPRLVRTSGGTTIYEGGKDLAGQSANDTVVFNVYTPYQADGDWYWTVSPLTGHVDDQTFVGSARQGTVQIHQNQGQITLQANANNRTDGVTVFVVQLRQTSYTSQILATSDAITIADSSTTPAEVIPPATEYEISTVNAQLMETLSPIEVTDGSLVTFRIRTTPHLSTSTPIYWTISTSDAATSDFTINQDQATVSNGVITGMVHVNAQGTVDIPILTSGNAGDAGTEHFWLTIREASLTNPTVIAKSPLISILQSVGYSVGTTGDVRELKEGGDAVTFNVTTPLTSAATLRYVIIPGDGQTIPPNYLVGPTTGFLYGSVAIGSNGKGSFTLQAPTSDKHPQRSFTIGLSSTNGETWTTISNVASPSFTISQPAEYTLSADAVSIQVGSTANITFTTPYTGVSSTYNWSMENKSGGTTDEFNAVFPTRSGSFTITAQSTSHVISITTAIPTSTVASNSVKSFSLVMKKVTSDSSTIDIAISGTNPVITVTNPASYQITAGQYLSGTSGDTLSFNALVPATNSLAKKWKIVPASSAYQITAADISAITGDLNPGENPITLTIQDLTNSNVADKQFTIKLVRDDGVTEVPLTSGSSPIYHITKTVSNQYSVSPAEMVEDGLTAVTVSVSVSSEYARTTLSWDFATDTGVVDASDFTSASLTNKTVYINDSGKGSFTITAAQDAITEADSFHLTFKKSDNTPVNMTSAPIITIKDLGSLSMTAVNGATSVTKGNSIAFTVSVPLSIASLDWKLYRSSSDDLSSPAVVPSVGSNVAVSANSTTITVLSSAVQNLITDAGNYYFCKVFKAGTSTEYPISDVPYFTVSALAPITCTVSSATVDPGTSVYYSIQLPAQSPISSINWGLAGDSNYSASDFGQTSGSASPDANGVVVIEVAVSSSVTKAPTGSSLKKFFLNNLTDQDGKKINIATIPTVTISGSVTTATGTTSTPTVDKTASGVVDTAVKVNSAVSSVNEGSSVLIHVVFPVIAATATWKVDGVTSGVDVTKVSPNSGTFTSTKLSTQVPTGVVMDVGINGYYGILVNVGTGFTQNTSTFTVTVTYNGKQYTSNPIQVIAAPKTIIGNKSTVIPIPAGVKTISVDLNGAGGGGGGADASGAGGKGGDATRLVCSYGLPANTISLSVVVGAGGGAGSSSGFPGVGGAGYKSGGTGGVFTAIGGSSNATAGKSGTGGGGGGVTAIVANTTSGQQLLLAIGGAGGGGGGSKSKVGVAGANATTTITSNLSTSAQGLIETAGKPGVANTVDGGSGGGGGGGGGAGGIAGKDSSTSAGGGTSGIVYSYTGLQKTTPIITTRSGTGGTAGVGATPAQPGGSGGFSISYSIELPITAVSGTAQAQSNTVRVYNTDTTWIVPPGVTAIRISAVGGGSTTAAIFGQPASNNPIQSVRVKSGASGAAVVTGVLPVTEGDIFTFNIGRGGLPSDPAWGNKTTKYPLTPVVGKADGGPTIISKNDQVIINLGAGTVNPTTFVATPGTVITVPANPKVSESGVTMSGGDVTLDYTYGTAVKASAVNLSAATLFNSAADVAQGKIRSRWWYLYSIKGSTTPTTANKNLSINGLTGDVFTFGATQPVSTITIPTRNVKFPAGYESAGLWEHSGCVMVEWLVSPTDTYSSSTSSLAASSSATDITGLSLTAEQIAQLSTNLAVYDSATNAVIPVDAVTTTTTGTGTSTSGSQTSSTTLPSGTTTGVTGTPVLPKVLQVSNISVVISGKGATVSWAASKTPQAQYAVTYKYTLNGVPKSVTVSAGTKVSIAISYTDPATNKAVVIPAGVIVTVSIVASITGSTLDPSIPYEYTYMSPGAATAVVKTDSTKPEFYLIETAGNNGSKDVTVISNIESTLNITARTYQYSYVNASKKTVNITTSNTSVISTVNVPTSTFVTTCTVTITAGGSKLTFKAVKLV
jgi:hypothetical protein